MSHYKGLFHYMKNHQTLVPVHAHQRWSPAAISRHAIPAPVAHFLLLVNSAAQTTAPVQVPYSQNNTRKRKVPGEGSAGGSPTGCRFPWSSGASALLCGCEEKEEMTGMRALFPTWEPGFGVEL